MKSLESEKAAPENRRQNERRGDNIILLDDSEFYNNAVNLLRTEANLDCRFAESSKSAIDYNSAAGTGFSHGIRFTTCGKTFSVLCLLETNSHPFSYLTLGALATQHQVASVIAITSAHSLRENLFPGDLTIVRRASALPYPALFQNSDPYESSPQKPENFEADPHVLKKYTARLNEGATGTLWQREIPQVQCGYAKHPTFAGELMPWAPEQFAELRRHGIHTISSAAAGVYEAQNLMPGAEIICLNQIRSNPNVDSAEQWSRYKVRFQAPVVNLLLKLISQCVNESADESTANPLGPHPQ